MSVLFSVLVSQVELASKWGCGGCVCVLLHPPNPPWLRAWLFIKGSTIMSIADMYKVRIHIYVTYLVQITNAVTPGLSDAG